MVENRIWGAGSWEVKQRSWRPKGRTSPEARGGVWLWRRRSDEDQREGVCPLGLVAGQYAAMSLDARTGSCQSMGQDPGKFGCAWTAAESDDGSETWTVGGVVADASRIKSPSCPWGVGGISVILWMGVVWSQPGGAPGGHECCARGHSRHLVHVADGPGRPADEDGKEGEFMIRDHRCSAPETHCRPFQPNARRQNGRPVPCSAGV